MIRWLAKCFDLAARDHFLPLLGLSSPGGSSRIANGVRRNSSRFHSLARRSSRFLALAARASTRFGKPSRRQKAPRRRPFHRLSDESGSHRVRARPPRARLGVKASRPMRLTTPKAALSDAPKFSAPTLLFPDGARFGGRGGMVRLRTKRTGHSRQVHQGHRIAFTGFVGKDNSSRYRKSFHDRDN